MKINLKDQLKPEENDQNDERGIVVVADAVIQPDAVMVKVFSTPIAPPAMFRSLSDMCVAFITVIFLAHLISTIRSYISFPVDCRISWIPADCNEPCY